MSDFRAKKIMRLDTIQRHYRLFRVAWETGIAGYNDGYSTKVAVGVWPKLFAYHSDAPRDWMITVFGLRIHYSRSYGGRFA